MRETEEIENYLAGKARPEEHLLMEAKMLINTELKEKTRWQQFTYRLIKSYGRKQVKQEIIQTEKLLFTEPEFANFRQQIIGIFK